MKSTLLGMLAAFMAVASFTADAAGIADTGKRFARRPYFMQSKFAVDGKSFMYVYNNDEEHAEQEYVILDDQFNEVRKITFSYPAVTATSTHWRRVQGPTGITENRMLYHEEDGVSLDQFTQQCTMEGFTRKEEHGSSVWFMPEHEYRYYGSSRNSGA